MLLAIIRRYLLYNNDSGFKDTSDLEIVFNILSAAVVYLSATKRLHSNYSVYLIIKLVCTIKRISTLVI